MLGHEPLGVVKQVGRAVETVAPGMRVVIPTHLFCGTCVMCARGLSAACLRARPEGPGAAYGYAGMGPYRGAQAELLRVPWADANCVRLPGEPGDSSEDDFVLLADAFVTGWHAATLAEVSAGDTVAVFGAGTIGLLAVHSALLRGARAVYCVDGIDARLDKAGELGAIPGRLPARRPGRADPRAPGPGRVAPSARRSSVGSTRSSTRSGSRPATAPNRTGNAPTR